MNSNYCQRTATLAFVLSLANQALAAPTFMAVVKRDLPAGAKAGLGIGIAVVIIIVALIATFFVIHHRRSVHNENINRERAILAGEKNQDGTDKPDKFTPEPQVSSIPRRNKSVKDRLMGPLYRGSMIEMPSMPNRARLADNSNRQSTMTVGDDSSFVNKPWTESSPRPSFSSKRATRMMMMM